MSTCTYVLGPCVDGTQSGKRCSAEVAPGSDRCPKHVQPRPVPRHLQKRRQVKCFGCNDLTGIRGAAYCDVCRPAGNPDLFEDPDRLRAAGRVIARCTECDCTAVGWGGGPNPPHAEVVPHITHRERCSQWTDGWEALG